MKRNKRPESQDAYDILLTALMEIEAVAAKASSKHDQVNRDRLIQAGRIARKALVDSMRVVVELTSRAP